MSGRAVLDQRPEREWNMAGVFFRAVLLGYVLYDSISLCPRSVSASNDARHVLSRDPPILINVNAASWNGMFFNAVHEQRGVSGQNAVTAWSRSGTCGTGS